VTPGIGRPNDSAHTWSASIGDYIPTVNLTVAHAARMRILLALLLDVVLLLRVSVPGGLAACADVRAVAPVATADAGAHAHHGGHGADVAIPADAAKDTGDDPRGAAPHGDPAHCLVTAGCAMVALASADADLAMAMLVDAPARAARVALPPSIHQTPEPPPPRA
jgi:hypothetical protein